MRYITIPLLALCLVGSAQTDVRQTTFAFSDGSRPTFVVDFPDADASQMESWYKGELKDISQDVVNKKETRASGARVPDVSPDTITVLCKADKLKKSGVVNLHIAFLVNGAWVGPTSDKAMIEGARNFCYVKAVAYKKMVLEKKLSEAEKILARLQGEAATMEKDKRRFEENIEKNQEKGTEAGKDKVQGEADLKTNEVAIDTKKAEVNTTPTAENIEALDKLVKENAKLKDRIERIGNQAVDAGKKVDELHESIRKNLADQEEKQKTIAAQIKSVEELRTALANVN